MFKNYIKTALRNVWKKKTFSVINITGLALGMAVSFLILLFVRHEVSYDRFHENSQNIYRIATHLDAEGRQLHVPCVPAPLGPKLKEIYPEILEVARLRGGYTRLVSFEDKLFEEEKIYYAEPSLLNIFTIKVLKGDPKTFLEAPFSLVLTQEMAEKYFGSQDPIGRTVKFRHKDDYTITGVVEKMPENSHFKFNMLASLSSMEKLQRDLNTWMGFNYFTYLRFQGSPDTAFLTQKYNDLLMSNVPEQLVKQLNIKIQLELQPLTSIHHSSYTEGEMEPPGNPAYIRIFTAIALFILLIACINFMNLSTAQSSQRAKEVGMRKVLGAERKKLITQFLGESLILSFISLGLAVLLILALQPLINALINIKLVFNPIKNWNISLLFASITLLVGILAGAYPAFFLSSFAPLEVFRSRFKAGKGHKFFRNGLVSLQYTISITLICSTIVIFAQLKHVKNYNLGFDKEHVVTISLRGNINSDVFKTEMLALPGVSRAAACSYAPTFGSSETRFSFEEVAEGGAQILPFVAIDEDYMDTMGLQIAAGRNFSRDFPSDTKAMILNQTLVNQLGWKDPIGKTVNMTDVDEKRELIDVPYTVIGVVKDFHFESLHQKLRGHIFTLSEDKGAMAIKISPKNTSATLASIGKIWQKLEPSYPFDYAFLDARVDRLYRTEQRLGNIFVSFTLIAIFVACLGLFGLASFTVEQRTKEIGIRKVLGASVSSLLLLLSRDFSKWVILANLLAWPIAYLVMVQWLQGFAYRIGLSLWIFLASGVIALLISLLTISSKSLKAAAANPIKSLHYE